MAGAGFHRAAAGLVIQFLPGPQRSFGGSVCNNLMLAALLKSDRLDELQRKAAEAGMAEEVALVGAQAVANFTKDYLGSLNSSRPNALGGNRTDFYSRAAKSIEVAKQGEGSVGFTIYQIGFAQRLLGGTIHAGAGTSSKTGEPTKYLAIPANPEAYGKTPGEFDNLEFFHTAHGGGLRAKRSIATWLRTSKEGNILNVKGARKASHDEIGSLVMFWLVTEVNQDPDPTVLPTEAELTNVATQEMSGYLARKLASH